MRLQRRGHVTVTLVHPTAAKDRLGNRAGGAVRTVIENALFSSPQPMAERTSPDQAEVLAPATFNLPGLYDVGADDLIQVGDYPTVPSAGVVVETWQVLGGGTRLVDRTRVPVTQARSS